MTKIRMLCIIFIILSNIINIIYSCNDDICGSIVSKCQLTGACQCDMTAKRCECCDKCSLCLDHAYNECCSCVGLCPDKLLNTRPKSYTSTVEDFQVADEFKELFTMLTENAVGRWNTFSYPSVSDFQHYTEQIGSLVQSKCTTAFIPDCKSLDECRDYCSSMGASKMRWFHINGCCQCVGSQCITYGKLEPMCTNCNRKSFNVEL